MEFNSENNAEANVKINGEVNMGVSMVAEREAVKTAVMERYQLAKARVKEIMTEECVEGTYVPFFQKTAAFLSELADVYEYVEDGRLYRAPMEELQKLNRKLYEDVLPEHYKNSYANPSCAVAAFGTDMGRNLSFLYAELRSLIVFAFEKDMAEITIRMELFLEVYTSFVCAWEEKRQAPGAGDVRQMLYWFVCDYTAEEVEKHLRRMLCPEEDFALRLIMDSDLEDLRYLYYFGEYITENELETARHLNAMSAEAVKKLADTYTEGYRIGFEATGKDISRKKTVNIRYCLGFERMIRSAVENFGRLGMKPTVYRAGVSIFQGKSVNKNGFSATPANKQYDFDHKDDEALYLDKQYVNRRLEALRAGYETLKKEASLFGGPAVVEIFGEEPFAPEAKEEALALDAGQQKLSAQYQTAAGTMQNEYIRGEERSFTIIAFPVPAIGEKYREIFDETVKINTLDYKLYQGIQQTIIDALDQAAYVRVKGMGRNRTDLKVMLHRLENPEKETNFENCVADVNIPVGEVFTSPRLMGTDGVLHVERVFLNGLEYRNLEITFRDGMVADYTCTNFDTGEENKKYMKDNVMFHHDTLPLGEFAVGTNTVAYVTAKKYGIGDKMPILIAEKMGPHFAVGDTCYSHEEDIMTYNPDGKAIVARENEISALRREDMEKAYFNCHTDITVPYDELGELTAVREDGGEIAVIREGRFVLEGCGELNKAFDGGM